MKIYVLLARFILHKIKRLTISVTACADQQQMKSLQIAIAVIIKNRLMSTIGASCNLYKIIIVEFTIIKIAIKI